MLNLLKTPGTQKSDKVGGVVNFVVSNERRFFTGSSVMNTMFEDWRTCFQIIPSKFSKNPNSHCCIMSSLQCFASPKGGPWGRWGRAATDHALVTVGDSCIGVRAVPQVACWAEV